MSTLHAGNVTLRFLVPGVGRSELHNFGAVFRSHARAALLAEGLSAAQVGRLIDDEPDCYAKADSRSVLGSMNDQMRTCKFYLSYEGGFGQARLAEVNRLLNRTPMSYIGMEGAGNYLKSVLASRKAV